MIFEENKTYEVVFDGKEFEISEYRKEKYDLYVYHTVSNSCSTLVYCYGKDIDNVREYLRNMYINELAEKIKYLQSKINNAKKVVI